MDVESADRCSSPLHSGFSLLTAWWVTRRSQCLRLNGTRGCCQRRGRGSSQPPNVNQAPKFFKNWYLPRGLCRHAVSLSLCVCPSVTIVDSVRTSTRIVKFFSPWAAILVFPHQTSWLYSDGNPVTGASNAGGAGRNRDSEPISGSIACCEPFQRQVQMQYTQVRLIMASYHTTLW